MFDIKNLEWTRKPKNFTVKGNTIEITTEPYTDLWQRTYYHFRNDNAPVLQMKTKEKYFSFVVKTEFESKRRFDQCGVVMYLNSDNWLKGSIEYENEKLQHLGSVVTNHGYSDWATTAIDASVGAMWYRLSRRENDFCIECFRDGVSFSQMRVCHMWDAADEIQFGVYACSPENSSFTAKFTNMDVTECRWPVHNGQEPDAAVIRKAVQADLDAVEEIYDHIHEQEQQKKMCVGWIPKVYPVRATAEKALERDDLFVYEEGGKILAAAILNQEQVDVYADCDWSCQAEDSEVMVMHTLVVEPAAAAKGIGKSFAEFYESYARQAGCKVLRIDTNEKNKVARRFYARLGYREAGILPCNFNGIPDVQLVLLEKQIV